METDLDKSNIFKYAKEHYRGLKSIDSSIKFENIMKECLRRKFFFWKENSRLYPDTKEKIESKKIINEVPFF